MRRDAIPVVSWQGLIFFALLLAFAILLYKLSPILTRRRLSRWAESRGFRLVSFSTVPFYEGPRASLRQRYKFDHPLVPQPHPAPPPQSQLLQHCPRLP